METVHVIADIFPAAISPRPEGVPSGAKLRIIVAQEALVVAWSGGKNRTETIINSYEQILTDPADYAEMTSRGGTVLDYTISRGPGCSCGSAGLKNWNPFEGMAIVAASSVKAFSKPAEGVTRYTRA